MVTQFCWNAGTINDLFVGQRELDYFKKKPAIEHKAGVAKSGLPLMEIKQKLDQVAKQISSYGIQELSADKFWSLRNQWEWLNTTKAELTKEAERELFSIPRSDVRCLSFSSINFYVLVHFHNVTCPIF